MEELYDAAPAIKEAIEALRLAVKTARPEEPEQ